MNEQVNENVTGPLCDSCEKREATGEGPGGEPLCSPCAVTLARKIVRLSKLERKRQARLNPPKMTIPKGRR